jgi:hypothetical protein
MKSTQLIIFGISGTAGLLLSGGYSFKEIILFSSGILISLNFANALVDCFQENSNHTKIFRRGIRLLILRLSLNGIVLIGIIILIHNTYFILFTGFSTMGIAAEDYIIKLRNKLFYNVLFSGCLFTAGYFCGVMTKF